MWWPLLFLIASCSFEHGALPRDGGVRTSDALRTDAPRPIDAAPPCPNNLGCVGSVTTTTCNGGCWATCTNAFGIGMLSVATACADWGGEVAPIRNAADQACVQQMLFPQQASWIGLLQSPFATAVGDGWSVNGDNVALTYTNWDTGQPNDANNVENGAEQCGFMTAEGKWQDTDCSSTALLRFSCRR